MGTLLCNTHYIYYVKDSTNFESDVGVAGLAEGNTSVLVVLHLVCGAKIELEVLTSHKQMVFIV
jgi:hypothetical protein